MPAKQTVTRLVPSDKVWDAMRSAALLGIMVAIAGMSGRSSGVRMLIKHQVLAQ